MGISFDITCRCGHPFNSDEAEFCRGCLVSDCGCGRRCAGDECSCISYFTLKCPACGVCVCNKVKKWKKQGKLQSVDDPRFQFVHKDYLKGGKPEV